jgi:hypothetical protein
MARTHRTKVLRRLGLPLKASPSLEDLARLTGVRHADLREVYDRGRGAWETNIASVRLKKDFSKNPDLAKYPRSARLTPEQWAYARVYSFLDQGRTFYTADQDIARKYVTQ